MPRSFDCTDPAARSEGLNAAAAAVGGGKLVVLPTDTVYGLGADAFTPAAVAALLRAKGRGRDMPVPVLIGSPRTLDGIATDISDVARDLVAAFWPGGLTVVCKQQLSLRWDLGDARGTVAVRMPMDPVALELLRITGPMAVSSANVSGRPPALDALDARAQLGDLVEVYLDGGPAAGLLPSSIVDVTGARPRLLRPGAISLADLRTVAPDLEIVP
jgi:tRNA threonylcarbamoyl adenosine modification protein (Sua5/YciO/YrdC/YwlC family)